MSNPGKLNHESMKCILRYVKSYTQHDLLFDIKAMRVKSLLVYVDVDHGETWTRENQRLDMFSLLQMSALVGDLLFKNIFFQSSTEAEYNATIESMK